MLAVQVPVSFNITFHLEFLDMSICTQTGTYYACKNVCFMYIYEVFCCLAIKLSSMCVIIFVMK